MTTWIGHWVVVLPPEEPPLSSSITMDVFSEADRDALLRCKTGSVAYQVAELLKGKAEPFQLDEDEQKPGEKGTGTSQGGAPAEDTTQGRDPTEGDNTEPDPGTPPNRCFCGRPSRRLKVVFYRPVSPPTPSPAPGARAGSKWRSRTRTRAFTPLRAFSAGPGTCTSWSTTG